MTFSHPLARDAKVWASEARDGQIQNVLAVVTTLSLDPQAKRYKEDKVERLKDAARTWLSDNPSEASGFILMNRQKDW
jgi:hypothetical protein